MVSYTLLKHLPILFLSTASSATSYTAAAASSEPYPTSPSLLDTAAGARVTAAQASVTPQIIEQFDEWVFAHEKEYESLDEKGERLLVWLENHALIETHNTQSPQPSYTLGHNPYSDLTHEEFRRFMHIGEFAGEFVHDPEKEFKFAHFTEEEDDEENTISLRGANIFKDSAITTTAKERRQLVNKKDDDENDQDSKEGKDWTSLGLIGPVRHQGHCGACWAFSAVGAIESVMAINKYKKMILQEDSSSSKDDVVDTAGLVIPLSEQNLLDCDTVYNQGCTGGLMTIAFDDEKTRNSNGICTEADYPYQQAQGTCLLKCTPVEGSIVKDHVDLVPRKNNALKEALNVAPVTAAMVAHCLKLQFYQKGIYDDTNCGQVTKQMGDPDCKVIYKDQDVCLPDVSHGVLVVGYGTDPDVESDVKEYFKVKNSWGDSWGEGGYFRLARFDEDSPDPMKNWGVSGILSILSYPVME